jgi:hypothetical protein
MFNGVCASNIPGECQLTVLLLQVVDLNETRVD